jgi:hypothetical protein
MKRGWPGLIVCVSVSACGASGAPMSRDIEIPPDEIDFCTQPWVPPDVPARPPFTCCDPSVLITAAGGGTLVGYGATVSIPAGAVAEDIAIVIPAYTSDKSPPPPAELGSERMYAFSRPHQEGIGYESLPDLPLLQPATVAITPSAALLASLSPVIAQYDPAQNRWIDLETRVEGKRLLAAISHLSAFAARHLELSSATCAFKPCGGDVTGRWVDKKTCGTTVPNPIAPQCPASVLTSYVGLNTEYVFAGDTFSRFEKFSGCFQLDVPPSCRGPGPCSEFESKGSVCKLLAGGACECHGAVGAPRSDGQGSFSVSGTTLTTTDAGTGAVRNHQYCVEGGTFLLQTASGAVIQFDRL